MRARPSSLNLLWYDSAPGLAVRATGNEAHAYIRQSKIMHKLLCQLPRLGVANAPVAQRKRTLFCYNYNK